jgi:hypothetical protein
MSFLVQKFLQTCHLLIQDNGDYLDNSKQLYGGALNKINVPTLMLLFCK